jgi:hypothetical protein
LSLPNCFGHLGIGCSIFRNRWVDEDAHRASADRSVRGAVSTIQLQIKDDRTFGLAGFNCAMLGLGLHEAAAESAPDFTGLVYNGLDPGLTGRRILGFEDQSNGEGATAIYELYDSLMNIYGAVISVHLTVLESVSNTL